MKKILLCTALCVLVCVGAGCGKPSEPPTLTPTLENAYVTIDYVGVSEDGTVCEDSTSIQELYASRKASLSDCREESVTFTVDSADADTQSVAVSFDKPLMQGDVTVTSVTVSRDRRVELTANGGKDVFTLAMDAYYSRPAWGYLSDLRDGCVDMTMCYDDGTLLTLYPLAPGNRYVFFMTFADDPDLIVRGTYTLEDDILTLYEDMGLSVTTLRRDARRGGWCVDADASARHTLARMPSLADRQLLSFGFSCEAVQVEKKWSYRITDFDGNTLLAEQKLENCPDIRPLSPTMLCIEAGRSARYLNTETGECSASYSGVLAANATHTVYVKNDQLIVEELGGEYARAVYDAATLGFQSVSDAILNGDLLTMLYRDAEDKLQANRLNWRTGEILPACPLTVTKPEVLENHDPHILDESGNTFLPPTVVSYSCTLSDDARVYYSGIEEAVLKLGGKWVDIPAAVRSYETFDMDNETLTAAGLEAQLKADVSAGLATAETLSDGALTLYRYNGESEHHAVLFADTPDGMRIYIGEADAALDHLAGELTGVAPLIKFSSTTT